MATKYNGIQKWLRTKRGQTFLNYAYSWGAAVVIAGALFKLTHTAGADIMLFLGMGTEVIVFILAGFEPQESLDAQELAEEAAEDAAIRAQVGASISEDTAAALAAAAARVPAGGGTIIIGGGNSNSQGSSSSPATSGTPVDAAQLAADIQSAPAFNSAQYLGMSPEMQDATRAYDEQLTELTDILQKVAEQSARLTRDSEEMENMNRTLTGINRFYEMQLKSVGTQSATIDEVNDQTKRLAAQLQELNEVYLKMVEALKMKIS